MGASKTQNRQRVWRPAIDIRDDWLQVLAVRLSKSKACKMEGGLAGHSICGREVV
jgi:hypothetical protein